MHIHITDIKHLHFQLNKSVRPSAHERSFAAAAEYFLAVRTDGESNAAFSHFPHYLSVCVVWILSSQLLCALFC